MKDIKIIFFDIDGTLIPLEESGVRDKTTKALKALKNQGIKICIATGRAPMQIPIIDQIDFDCHLAFNGALCYNDRDDIFSNSLSKDDLMTFIKNARDMNKPLGLASRSDYVANFLNDDLAEYFSFGSTSPTIVDDIEKFALNNDVYQMVMPIRKEEYISALKDTKFLKITAWWDRAVDVIPQNGGKGLAVEKILDYYGFDKNEALAFGDGDNDIEMFETIRGVAMGNASENLKNIAYDTCKSVNEDGIYYYLKDKEII